MKQLSIEHILPELVGGIAGLIMWGRLAPAFRWLALYLFITTGVIVLCFAWIDWYKTNFPPFHIYSNMCFLFYGMILIKLQHHNRYLKTWGTIMLLLLPLAIVYSLTNQHYMTFPSIHNNVRDVLAVISGMLLLPSLIDSDYNQSLWKNELLWFVVAILIYHSTTFFIWSYISTVRSMGINDAPELSEISNVLGVLYYSMLSVSMLLHISNQKKNVTS
jgi:hypothetical protein